MITRCRKNQFSKLFLVCASIVVLGGGLCLAGKPGGGGSQNTSLSTVIEGSVDGIPFGLCPDTNGAYINGNDGVRSLFLGDGAYGFTSDYQRSKTGPRMVILKNLGEPFPTELKLPIHLALDWNVRDLEPAGGSNRKGCQ